MNCCAICGVVKIYALYDNCGEELKRRGVNAAIQVVSKHIWTDQPEPGRFFGRGIAETMDKLRDQLKDNIEMQFNPGQRTLDRDR